VNLDLQSRNGWPDELRLLIDRYPREIWTGHANLGEMARFWLDRHQSFRDLGKALGGATDDFREGRMPPDAFRRFFAPRLQFFLQNLEGHHQIEDLHFFPPFRTAEKRLVKGFDVLEEDHETIHAEIMRTVESANKLLSTMESDDDARRKATDLYADASERLLKFLVRHLDDEEDLIMPVILDQGERTLFGMQY
jgi:hemerythrin-like domain-containing protein